MSLIVVLGPVYPGQVLKVDLCIPGANYNNNITEANILPVRLPIKLSSFILLQAIPVDFT